MPIKAIFSAGVDTLTVSGLHQWDYGQKLEIHGLGLPAMIEVHFACLNMQEAHVRIGTTADGVTTVAIPDGCLEHDTPLRAWVYVVDTTSGRTEKTIMLPITARTKPQGADSRPPFVVDEYAAALEQINTTVASWRDGIVDQNDGGKTKVWTGTRAQFNELEQTDPRTMYVITDELPDYTDLVEAYARVIEALAFMTNVENGDESVPKATQAHYDMSGRALNQMGYFGGKFQQVDRLTEPGVYQMYLQGSRVDGSKSYFAMPLVCFDSEALAAAQLVTMGDATVTIYADGTLAHNLGTALVYTFYARKVSPTSGW